MVGTWLTRFWAENWLTVVVVTVLVVAYLALRMSPSEIASVDGFLASLEAGQPTVLVFYSNT